MSSTHPSLDIIVTGRNDGYGGEDFAERMFTAAAFNHRMLSEAGVPHRFTLVEWNTPADRPLLTETVRARLPWWDECYVVSRRWHEKLSTNPRLQFMEFFAKNVAIRRSPADWILTTNSDIFLSREVVEALASRLLQKGTLYRATRLDIDRTIDWRRPTWELFEDQGTWLRQHTLEGPDYGNGAGDFLLLDRQSYHRVGGFNEIVRFAKIYKDGQFCLQCRVNGMAIEVLGPLYHLDHDGSFVTANAGYGPKHELAHYGPWWDSSHPYTNRRDWGLTAATEERDHARGCTWLYTPEERGPELSVVLHGRAGRAATDVAVQRLLAAHPSAEVVVARAAEPGSIDNAMPREIADRVREVTVPAAASWATALSEGLAHARGRLLTWLAQPAYFTSHDVAAMCDRFAEKPALDGITCGEQFVDGSGRALSEPRQPDPSAAVAVVRRRVYETLPEIDPLSHSPLADYWAGAASRCTVETMPQFVARVVIEQVEGINNRLDSIVAAEWRRYATADESTVAGPLSEVLLRDYRRRSDLLVRVISDRLRTLIPPGVRDVALEGVDVVTPLVVAAVRRLGVRVVQIYSDQDAFIGERCAGVPVVRREPALGSEPVVIALVVPKEKARTPGVKYLFAALAEDLPLAHDTIALGALGTARDLVTQGRTSDALEVFLALFDPDRREPALVLEMAEVAEQAEQFVLAIDIYQRLMRRPFDAWQHQHEQLLAYRLGSLFKRLGRPARALRYLKRTIRAQWTDDAITGAAHFHIGELLSGRGETTAACEHYRLTLQCIPGHRKAAERTAESEVVGAHALRPTGEDSPE